MPVYFKSASLAAALTRAQTGTQAHLKWVVPRVCMLPFNPWFQVNNLLQVYFVLGFVNLKLLYYWYPLHYGPGEANGNPLQYSCLENPMDRGAWWATDHGVAQSRS